MYSQRILKLLLKYASIEENLIALYSIPEFDFAFFLEKLFCLSLSKSINSVLATDLLLLFKRHPLLAFYMDNLAPVFDNHALELLYLIKESCEYIELSALKTPSVCYKVFNFRYAVYVSRFGKWKV